MKIKLYHRKFTFIVEFIDFLLLMISVNYYSAVLSSFVAFLVSYIHSLRLCYTFSLGPSIAHSKPFCTPIKIKINVAYFLKCVFIFYFMHLSILFLKKKKSIDLFLCLFLKI